MRSVRLAPATRPATPAAQASGRQIDLGASPIGHLGDRRAGSRRRSVRAGDQPGANAQKDGEEHPWHWALLFFEAGALTDAGRAEAALIQLGREGAQIAQKRPHICVPYGKVRLGGCQIVALSDASLYRADGPRYRQLQQ
jgi:hypothetical protein